VKILLVNNHCHGSVRQLQARLFDGRYPTTVLGYDAPDFRRVAEAYGVAALSVSDPGEVDDKLRWLFHEPRRPAMLEAIVDTDLDVYPNVPFGSPLTSMESWRRQTAAAPA
jgi:acetolactate synthase-1/2/3 large subunit